MRRLGDTVARLAAARSSDAKSGSDGRLRNVTFAGPNPGGLDALGYTPPTPAGGALVVVLHGCTQTAAAYDHGSGWSRHAVESGFSVLYPQQRRTNNPGLCFNWFSPDDTARGRGEAASIAEMIAAMVREHDLDPARVFITGLSAGGAMSAVLLATYPELFAGGAIIAGLPYGAAASMPEAFEAMRGQGAAPGAERVRRAAPAPGRWPRITVVHGAADRTVDVANAERLLTQWLGVHGLSASPDSDRVLGRRRHRTWLDGSGEVLVEDFRIEGMGHGTPLDVRSDPFGAPGPFMLDVGFASTAGLIAAWGLGDVDRVTLPHRETSRPVQRVTEVVDTPALSATGGIQAVIENALRRAGLMP